MAMAFTFLATAILFLQLLVAPAVAKPVAAFPFNAQLPPVARTGSLFTYAFSEHTFTSDLPINYTLGDGHPTWLSLESSERRLYGIPPASVLGSSAASVVGQTVDIIATDDEGSTTMAATIVVSRNAGPSIRLPLSSQIDNLGAYSAPSSLLTYPSKAFRYVFDTDTFRHVPNMVNYYATSGDGSPLPAWITFTAGTLTFSGTTPGASDLYQTPQAFSVRLIASDIEGFSAVSLDFSIVVGAHMLSTDDPVIRLNSSRGKTLRYSGLEDGVRLDGKTVQPGDLNVSTTNLPDWLSFDPETWLLEGTPTSDAHSTNFSLSFSDAHADTLDVMAIITVATDLFSSTFRDIEAVPGEHFSLNLKPHFKDPDDVTVSFDTDPDQDWLSLNGFLLQGTVPKKSKGEVSVDIHAKSKSSDRSETESLTMTFLAPDGTTTTTPTTTAAMPTGTGSNGNKNDGTTGSTGNGSGKKHGIGRTAILLATIIPILFVALLALLAFFLVRRRRSRRTYLSKDFRSKISHPVAGSLRHTDSAGDSDGPTLAGVATRDLSSAEGEKHNKAAALAGIGAGAAAGAAAVSSRRFSDASSRTAESLSRYMLDTAPAAPAMSGATAAPASESSTEGDNGSWFTTEEMPAAAAASTAGGTDLQRHQTTTTNATGRTSDVTAPHSTHQLLPTPPLPPMAMVDEPGFRNRLDLTIPTLEEIPSMKPTQKPREMSTVTTSSAALPRPGGGSHITNSYYADSQLGQPMSWAAPPPALSNVASRRASRTDASDWSTIREDESDAGVLPELPRQPEMARLSSYNNTPAAGATSTARTAAATAAAASASAAAASATPLAKRDVSSSHNSFLSDTSFGSMENWRVIGQTTGGAPSLAAYRPTASAPLQSPLQANPPMPMPLGAPPSVPGVGSASVYSGGPGGAPGSSAFGAGSASAASGGIRPVHEVPEDSYTSRFSGLSREVDEEEDDGLSAGAEACNWKRPAASEGSFKVFL